MSKLSNSSLSSIFVLFRGVSFNLRIKMQERLLKAIHEENFIFIRMLLFVRSFSNRYALGGIRGYSVNGKKINPFQILFNISSLHLLLNKKTVLAKKLGIQVPIHFKKYNSNQKVRKKSIDNLRILAIVPDDWSSNIDDYGFPHLLHLKGSATNVGANFKHLYLSKILSDVSAKNFTFQIRKVQTFRPNLILVSGHKNSYSKELERFFAQLKKAIDIKIFMIFFDDWNDDYARIPRQWSSVVDYFLLYEYNSYVEQVVQREGGLSGRLLVAPIPRAELLTEKSSFGHGRENSVRFGFIGSIYLNRLPWLYAIKHFLSNQETYIPLEIVSSQSPGNHRKTIEQYLKFFQDKNKFVFHFLERTPNVFSFTSSVWDAFSVGSLVIAQVGTLHDPIEEFFLPGVHYLRFSNGLQLSEILVKLIHDPQSGIEIANSGHIFWRQNYSGRTFYEKLRTLLI